MITATDGQLSLSDQAKTLTCVISLYSHHNPISKHNYYPTVQIKCVVQRQCTHRFRPFSDPRDFPLVCVLSLSLGGSPRISIFNSWHHLSPSKSNPNSLQFSKDCRVPITGHLLLVLPIQPSSASQEHQPDPNQPFICETNSSFFKESGYILP